MSRKFGKANVIKIDPLAYNICLLGEPKIGKTTVIKEMLEKLVGENGYIFLEMAGEAGADAINNIVFEDVDEWEELEDIVEDIEYNKDTDYADLKVIVADTYDGWIKIAEEEAIRLWNKDHADKKADSIDSAWNGFQKGQKKAFELIFDIMVRLDKIGVKMIIIGHVKNKELTDIATGNTYQTLTSDVERIYFNLLKKKMHFLGLAYYDRTIITEKTGKKNIVTKKDETKNIITEEARKIKFRDDNMALDSGCRFADIVEEIPLNADALINALQDAIKKEYEKNSDSKPIEVSKKEQEIIKNKKVEENALKKKEEIDKKKELELRNNLIEEFKTIMVSIRDDKEKVIKVTKKMKELGLSAKELDSADVNVLKEFMDFVKGLV
ncbi:MAG: ATP-binding protein [Clostridium sp.]|uniref:AAA family ATPase n=1 Tax=Clostridium sp. TaxID=1506 RepID=UPI0025C134A8|nr:AAA family ATPase [Clostridium sp.]MCE5220224.1 ATP-binding protein [Clostridium sp.]